MAVSVVLTVWTPIERVQEAVGEKLRYAADREQIRTHIREGEYQQAVDYADEHGYEEGFVREQADAYARKLADQLAAGLSNWMTSWEDKHWEKAVNTVAYFDLDETRDYIHEKAQERMTYMLDRTDGVDGKTQRAQQDIVPSSLPVDKEDAREYVRSHTKASAEDAEWTDLIDAFELH